LINAGPEKYQFDTDGFLTKKITSSGTLTTSYSSNGRLLSVSLPTSTLISYDHDPMGRRIAKRVNGSITEKYLWKDDVTLLAVYDGNNNLIMSFTYADGRMPVSMNYGISTYYLAFDQVGTLRMVTDASGLILKRIDYDSFGSIINDTNPTMNIPFGFAGGLHDRDTGLVRFGVRDYDPTLGRWTAKDPIDFKGEDINLYKYVLNDPIGKIDVSGLYPGPCGNQDHTWVPDNPYWVFDFTEPCQNHDDCYGCQGQESNYSKSKCDFRFWLDMQKVCAKYIFNPHLFLLCQTAANQYYNAVFWGANSAFENARNEKCNCR